LPAAAASARFIPRAILLLLQRNLQQTLSEAAESLAFADRPRDKSSKILGFQISRPDCRPRHREM